VTMKPGQRRKGIGPTAKPVQLNGDLSAHFPWFDANQGPTERRAPRRSAEPAPLGDRLEPLLKSRGIMIREWAMSIGRPLPAAMLSQLFFVTAAREDNTETGSRWHRLSLGWWSRVLNISRRSAQRCMNHLIDLDLVEQDRTPGFAHRIRVNVDNLLGLDTVQTWLERQRTSVAQSTSRDVHRLRKAHGVFLYEWSHHVATGLTGAMMLSVLFAQTSRQPAEDRWFSKPQDWWTSTLHCSGSTVRRRARELATSGLVEIRHARTFGGTEFDVRLNVGNLLASPRIKKWGSQQKR
jgi:hypothetical protein